MFNSGCEDPLSVGKLLPGMGIAIAVNPWHSSWALHFVLAGPGHTWIWGWVVGREERRGRLFLKLH